MMSRSRRLTGLYWMSAVFFFWYRLLRRFSDVCDPIRGLSMESRLYGRFGNLCVSHSFSWTFSSISSWVSFSRKVSMSRRSWLGRSSSLKYVKSFSSSNYFSFWIIIVWKDFFVFGFVGFFRKSFFGGLLISEGTREGWVEVRLESEPKLKSPELACSSWTLLFRSVA